MTQPGVPDTDKSRYDDWPQVYAEERRRGLVNTVSEGSLSGRPGVRGIPARPDVSTQRRPRYRRPR